MNTKLLATIFRWVARVIGTVLVSLTVIIAIGEGTPDLFRQSLVIQIGFLALTLVLLGMLLAWRWEFLGGMMSLSGWVLFILAERINWQHSGIFILFSVPGLLFLGSFFLRRHYEKDKSV